METYISSNRDRQDYWIFHLHVVLYIITLLIETSLGYLIHSVQWYSAFYLVNTVYVGSVFAINVGIFILYNSVLYAIYTLKHPFFEQYKNTDKPWPWE